MDWSADMNIPLAIVLIPGAGGFSPRKDKLVRACEAYGETILLDYPEMEWCFQNADLGRVAEELHRRLCNRMAHRPFALAGASLGAIVASLIAEIDQGGLNLIRVIAIDPAGSQELTAPVEGKAAPGWVARNLRRARYAGLGGSPGFIWVRLNRIAAILLARWLRRKVRIAGLTAFLLRRAGLNRFAQQLRMRLLIDVTTTWRRDPARRRSAVVPSKVACKVLQTAATSYDADFWSSHFNSVGVTNIGGDHDTWYDFEGPQLLINELVAVSGQVRAQSRVALARHA
jgi:hypothetical protein